MKQFHKLLKYFSLIAFLLIHLFFIVSCEDLFTPINPITLEPLLDVSIEGDSYTTEELIAVTDPVDASVSYQWLMATEENGDYEEIPGATTDKYTVLENQEGLFLRVKVTGKEEYIGTVVSKPIGPIEQINYYKLRVFLQTEDGEDYEKRDEEYVKIDSKIGTEIVAPYENIRGFVPNRNHPDRLDSGVVTWLNRLRIILYYDREVYDVNFESNGGSEVNPIEGVRYQNVIEKPNPNPTKMGYEFVNWYSDVELENEWIFANTKVLDNTTLYARWRASGDTKYEVKHYLRGVGSESYTLKEDDTKIEQGFTNQDTRAKANNYPGFTALEIQQKPIAPDGSTIIEVYYNRNKYNLTYSITGDFFPEEVYELYTYDFEAEVEAIETPSRVGYAFIGWDDVPETMPAGDATVVGYYLANSDTAYTVEHYQKEVGEETYILVETDTEYKKGTTGQNTKAEAKYYAGFTAQEILQEPIAPDGSTLVKVYYDRNKYNLTYSITGEFFPEEVYELFAYEFGAPITLPEEPEREGYTFRGWSNLPENMVMPANDRDVTGYYTVNRDTSYSVEHWRQNISDDCYTLAEMDSLSGTTDRTATAVAKDYAGFKAPASIPSGNISGDGTLVLKVYYDRETYDVMFYPNGGSEVPSIEGVRYESNISVSKDSKRDGYTLEGWYKDLSFASNSKWDFANSQVTSDLDLFAKWTANEDTLYSVEHWHLNISDDDYTLKETESLSGTTDTPATAVAKDYTGFKAPASVPSGNIAGDGSLVLKVYYDRETYSVIFDSGGGSDVDSLLDVRYETKIDIPASPSREGYRFTGWDKIIPATVPANNLTITALWDINQYTISFDSAGGSAVDSITQDFASSITPPSAPTRLGYSFTGWDVDIPETMPAGDLTIRANWEVLSYGITYDLAGGANDLDNPSSYTVEETVSLKDATRSGYTFTGWFNAASGGNEVEKIEKGTTGPLTLYARWIANTDTSYTVERWHQNISDDGYTLKETESLIGTTDTTVTAVAKDYTGFKAPASIPSGNIAGNGSLVLKVYYDRETYDVMFYPNGGSEVPSIEGVRYESNISVSKDSKRDGYTLEGWYEDLSFASTSKWDFANSQVISDLDLFAKWVANEDTLYSVEHWHQNISDDDYTLKETETLSGTTDTTATAVAKDYAGFKIPASIPSDNIAGDGSLVLKVYYDRETYNVTFDAKGGSAVDLIEDIRYEAKIEAPQDPTREGYTFADWFKDDQFEYRWEFENDSVTKDTILIAKWAPKSGITYTVEHYKQNKEGNDYFLEQEEVFNGTTDTPVTADVKVYTGFEAPANIPSGTIAGDGSLVLKVYYNRKSFTVTFNDKEGELLDSQEVLYENDAVEPENLGNDLFYLIAWDRKFTDIREDLDVYGIYLKMEGDDFLVERDYTDNNIKVDSIKLVGEKDGEEKLIESASDEDPEVLNGLFKFYSDENKSEEITTFDLSNGGTTFRVYVGAANEEHKIEEKYVRFKYKSVTIGKNDTYYTIEDALERATSGVVYVKHNTSFAEKDIADKVYNSDIYYEVKYGVTLLLPYNKDLSTGIKDDRGNNNQGITITKNSAYVELTVPSNTTLKIKGTLTINAQRGSSGTKHMGHVHQDNYSQLHLKDSSKIEVKSGGELNSIGFIYGEGIIEAESGSEVREPLFIKGFRGGTATSRIEGDVFPFDQFTINNIESELKIEQGAKYTGVAMIYVRVLLNSQYFHGDLVLIHDNESLLKLTSGNIIKKYDSSNGNVTLELNGDASLNDGSISVSQISANSKNKDMPFDGTWHFVVSSGSSLEINTYVALLPGSTMTVESGGTVTIKSGKRLTIYDPYEHIDEYNTYPDETVKNYRVNPTISFSSNTPATLKVLGELVVEGNLAGRVLGEYSPGNNISPYEVKYVIGSAGEAEVISREVALWEENDTTISVTKDKQSHVRGDTDDILLEVLVKNSNNEPLSGVDVDFSITKGKGSFATVSYTTDVNGKAVANYITSDDEDEGELILKATATSTDWEISANAIIEVKKNSGDSGGCPLIYSHDGTDYYAEVEPVPTSANLAFETTSFGTLRGLKEIDGSYRIKIGEDDTSETYVNGVNLYAVEYRKDSGVIEALTDIDGTPRTITERIAPKSFIDSQGKDRLDELTSLDEIVSSPGLSMLESGQYVETYEAIFDLPQERGAIAKLMVKTQESNLTMDFVAWYHNLIDGTQNVWWLERALMANEGFWGIVDAIGMLGLEVEVWDGEEWVYTGTVASGTHFFEEFLVPIDLDLLKDNPDELRVRFKSGSGFVMIDTVYIDFSPDEVIAAYPLVAKEALFNGTEDVLPILSSLENGERVKLQKGDYIDLYYEASELPQQYGRSFMVDFTGYYHWGLESKSNPVVNSWDNLDYEGIIDSVLHVQPEARDVVHNLEWLFELTEPTLGQSMEYKIENIYVKYALP